MGFAVFGALTIRVVCVLSISAAFDGACQGERRAPDVREPVVPSAAVFRARYRSRSSVSFVSSVIDPEKQTRPFSIM